MLQVMTSERDFPSQWEKGAQPMQEFNTNCAFYVRSLYGTPRYCRALYNFYDDYDHDCTECPFFRDVDTYEDSVRRPKRALRFPM